MKKSYQIELRRLRQLRDNRDAQAEYALELLTDIVGTIRRRPGASTRELMQAVLRVLGETPRPDSRDPLLELYAYLAEQGEVRDPGAYVRAATLHALRPNLLPADQSMLAEAVCVYEFLPPAFDEEATPLRAAALIGLTELNDEQAQFHAVRLLADPYVQPMSGEPALTAVRVLGAQSATIPLYFYAMLPEAHSLPEVVSEALRQLTMLPAALLPGLVERYGKAEQDVVLAGLFDLLLNHEEGPCEAAFMIEFLRSTKRMELYHYLVASIVSSAASGTQTVLPELLEYARWEQQADKVAVLVEALALLAHHPDVADTLEKLHMRLT